MATISPITNKQSVIHLNPDSVILEISGEDIVVLKSGAINGYTSFIGFNPTKQIGLVVLCSCDETDINQSLLQIPLYLWLRA
jgi:hypothetical protein